METRQTHWPGRAFDYAVLAAAWALTRLPFAGAFDLVSHDGAYYVTQAREILAGSPGAGGAFPPGYPILIALAHAFIGDGVRAAQTVSMLASFVATLALYLLARKVIPRLPSLLCALVFTATPLFARSSLSTMSEAPYLAWLILAMLAYARERRTLAGLSLGAAALTRPEALAIAVGLFVYDAVRTRSRARVVAMAMPFAALYSLNLIVPAIGGGPVQLLPKAGQFGQGAAGWRALESATIPPGPRAMMTHYIARLPGDLALLFRHTGGLALIAAIVSMVRYRGFLLVALIPLFVAPAFTLRPEPRFVLPFVPFVVLYAFVGAAMVSSPRARRLLFASLLTLAVAAGWWNRPQLTVPESAGFEAARHAGLQLQGRIPGRATVADRKPFLAFYADARYREIPAGTYDTTLDSLAAMGVDYLALMTGVTDFFRPGLEPLLYNDAAVLGETRLHQVYADASGISVFQRIERISLPQARTVLVADAGALIESPRWTTDGRLIMFVANRHGNGAVCTVGPQTDGSAVDTLALVRGRVTSAAPSPDGRHVVFVTTESGAPDIALLDTETGETSPLVRSGARDADPAWDGNDAVVYASEVGRHFGVYRVSTGDTRSSAQRILTGDRERRPRYSRDGVSLAWTRGDGVRVAPRGDGTGRWAALLRAVSSTPAWSPDGRHLVVSSRASGSDDVYIVDVESLAAVRVTTDETGDESAPDWHPGANRIAYLVNGRRIEVLDDVSAYLERLHSGERPRTHGKAAGRMPDGL